ncbi:hypothetical protein C8J57DRAFT_1530953 [Mycena rebaudengoi]|nr:hypothetical protein C8J57DRAFT_1530953 [Mycena rebaudengoi]
MLVFLPTNWPTNTHSHSFTTHHSGYNGAYTVMDNTEEHCHRQRGAITAPELERALINGDWTPFDMTIFDTDCSGMIGFNQEGGLCS